MLFRAVAAYAVSALIISLTVGLFGFRESTMASYVTESLIIESVAVIALLAWTVLVASRVQPPDRQPGPAVQRRPSRANRIRS